MKCSVSFSLKGITDVDPAMVTVDLLLLDTSLLWLPQPSRNSVTERSSKPVLAILMLYIFRILTVPYYFAFHEEDDQLGDADRMVGESLKVFGD